MSYQPTPIPGLPSPYDAINGLVYFPRMIAKIRLHAEGKLPASHHEMVGAVNGFDGRCVRFLGVSYDALKARTLAGSESAEELLEWCFANGRKPDSEEIEIWSTFLMKRGWRDSARSALEKRLKESDLPLHGDIVTMFDYIDYDEGHPARTPSA